MFIGQFIAINVNNCKHLPMIYGFCNFPNMKASMYRTNKIILIQQITNRFSPYYFNLILKIFDQM